MNKKYSLWINDFKPQSLDDVTGNKKFITLIQRYIKNTNDIPNMILIGKNGIGKKTLAKLIAAEAHLDDILYIDVNMNKSRDIINNELENGLYDVLSFSKKKSQNKKIIIINNFEELNENSQHSMRDIIEKYNKTTAFILTANLKNKIIEAIQSRFLIFSIDNLNSDDIYKILYNIIKEKENEINLKLDNNELSEILKSICIFSNNDIKCAINYLQIFSYAEIQTVDNFFKMFNIPSFVKISEMIMNSKNNLNISFDILNDLLLHGHNANDILQIIIKYITVSNLENKHIYLEYITDVYIKMDISPSNIQLINLLRKFNSI